jgi:hypothetical protein
MLKNMIAFLALTCLCGVALGLSPDYIYWKCENSGYLWQTDKTGQNPVQVRAAAWMGGFDSPLAAMTPDGAIIVEMIGQIWYAGIRKHDAASGSYVDMRLWGYDPEAGGSVGCDNNYIYFCCDYPGNVIDKFRISDGYHVSGTTIDRYSNYCFNLAVMNDTVWVGDGSGYLYAYPVSWMDGGNHSAARSQYIGDMSGTPLGMTWDGTYYYIAGSPNYLRVYNRDWSIHTDCTVGSGLPSVISPMAVSGPQLEPPEPPTLVSPENLSVDQRFSGNLEWEPAARADFYDVYLGKTDPPTDPIAANLTGTTCTYQVGDANQTYYWKVVAKGGRYSTPSLVWSFTSGNQPGWFDLSTPAKGALGLPIEGDLTWQASERATSYEVTLGSNTYTTSTNSYHYSGLIYGASYTWNVTATNNDGHTVSLNGPFSFSTSMEKILADCLYWKCANSAYLWQTDKTGQNPKQARAAAWADYDWSPLAAMNPSGTSIVEGMSGYSNRIRKHNAVSGSYVDMHTSYWLLGGAVGCDNSYVYYRHREGSNEIRKFRMSDGGLVSVTSIDQSGWCDNFAVMNDTVWVGDGSSYLYAYPTSQMDGGSHSAARSQYIGDMPGTPMGMTWDGTYYHIAGSPNALRVYNRDWSIHTDYTVGSGLPSVISPMAVAGPDVGVADITEPSGVIDTLTETPKATVHNFGVIDCDLTVWFEIRYGASDGPVQYERSVPVCGLGSVDQTVLFPLWDVPKHQDGLYYAKSWTDFDADIDATNDTARSRFEVEGKPQEPPAWTAWTDVPAGLQNRVVQQGAAMATDPMGLFVYLLKGNNTCEFYRFDPATKVWSALDPIPERGLDNVPRTVKEGGTLAQVGGKFYATKGGNSLEFWEYDPAALSGQRWTQKEDVPAGSKGVSNGAGAAGVQDGPNSYVFLLKASGTFEAYWYNVGYARWEDAYSDAPGDKNKKWAEGSCVTSDGVSTVYALKGEHNEFYAYDVYTSTWLAKPDLPLGPKNKQAKGGAAICYHLGKVYCIKGSNSQEFWVYDCNANTWTQGPDVTLGEHKTRVQDGGALVYCRSSRYLFATKGNCLELWSFGKLTNVGGPMDAASAPVPIRFSLAVSPSVTNSHARVHYAIPKAGNVGLKLYEVTGRCAAVLRNGWCEPGRYTASLSAKGLARGVYILKLESDACNLTRKVVIE